MSEPSPQRARRGLAGALAIAPFAMLLVSTLLWPEPPPLLPSHWSSDRPDELVTGGAFFSVALTVAGLCAILAALVALLSRAVPASWSRWLIAALALVGSAAAASYAVAVLATLSTGDPGQVGVGWPLLGVLLGLAWATLTYVVHARRVPSRAELVDRIPERDRVVPAAVPATGRPEPVRWGTTVGSRLLTALAVFVWVVIAVALTILVRDGQTWSAVLLGVLGLGGGLFALAWSRVDLGVDDSGLTVRSAVLPITLLQVPAEEVLGVGAADLDPMAWGGYGLRALPDRTAYIVAGGPGLVVHRTDGRRLAVEVTEGELVATAGARALLTAAGRAGRGASSDADG